jgi:hypothetical protein
MKSPDKLTYERFCGIWVNKDYEPEPGESKPGAKFTMNPDGTYIVYTFIMQSGPTGVGIYTVEKRWTDSDGNSYYHVKTWSHLTKVTQYELWRIDKYNSIFEFNFSNNEYPESIDPKDKHTTYRIYYRF